MGMTARGRWAGRGVRRRPGRVGARFPSRRPRWSPGSFRRPSGRERQAGALARLGWCRPGGGCAPPLPGSSDRYEDTRLHRFFPDRRKPASGPFGMKAPACAASPSPPAGNRPPGPTGIKPLACAWLVLAAVWGLAGCAAIPDTPSSPPPRWEDSGAVTLCCHRFPRELIRRVPPVLERAPGVTRIEEVGTTRAELCYRLHYRGPVERLEAWIEDELRADAARPFRIERNRAAGTLDLFFDAGFD